jgi:hypothetical protein
MMNTHVQERLADIRMQMVRWSSLVDTSGWNDEFFLNVIDDKNREIKKLRAEKRRLCKIAEDLSLQLDQANTRLTLIQQGYSKTYSEILIFNRQLTASEEIKFYNYLAIKYGFTPV